MDPLSDVLSLLKLRSYWSAGFDFGGEWAIALGPHEGIKFYAFVTGECWLAVDGVPEPLRVVAGDCLLLPRGRAFRFGSDLNAPAIDPTTYFPDIKDGGIRSLNGGGGVFGVGGNVEFAGEGASALIGLLPPIVHVHREDDKFLLRMCVERMRQELRDPQPGGFIFAQQLAMMLLVQALRVHLAAASEGGVGWHFALTDKQMAAAIYAIHADPAGRWTVRSLAERAGMSRTSFSLKFKDTVGASPMEYLTHRRMMLAGDRLVNSGDPVSEIARSLGYESESAFSTAFKRVVGTSPRQYGRGWKEPHRARRADFARPLPIAIGE